MGGRLGEGAEKGEELELRGGRGERGGGEKETKVQRGEREENVRRTEGDLCERTRGSSFLELGSSQLGGHHKVRENRPIKKK